jgi:hypothetical protein
MHPPKRGATVPLPLWIERFPALLPYPAWVVVHTWGYCC